MSVLVQPILVDRLVDMYCFSNVELYYYSTILAISWTKTKIVIVIAIEPNFSLFILSCLAFELKDSKRALKSATALILINDWDVR